MTDHDPFTLTPEQAAAREALHARIAARRMAADLARRTGLRLELHTEPPQPEATTSEVEGIRYARADFPVRWPDEAVVVHRSDPFPLTPDVEARLDAAARKAYDRHTLTTLDWDTPVHTDPQAQGDVFVLPWLETTTPAWRADRVAATVVVADTGCAVTPDGRHVLVADTIHDRPGVRFAYFMKGHTLGTLVVEDGYVARLSHPEHGDLLIGPGVYVLHTQRTIPAGTPTPAPAAD